jgi:hypothetical protein
MNGPALQAVTLQAQCQPPFCILKPPPILITTLLLFSGLSTTVSMTQMLVSQPPTSPILLCGVPFSTNMAPLSEAEWKSICGAADIIAQSHLKNT